MISAEVICDSVSEQNKRLTTFKLRYPKFIHGEFMTHRVISRNASSSRAVPTAKLIEEVRSNYLMAKPVWWGKNQPGMQAHEELSDAPEPGFYSRRTAAIEMWEAAARNAADHAEELMKLGAHKQIVNRLLEPFSHINVVATATEWDNFFGLRLHKDAQPEMRALAIAMWKAHKASVPRRFRRGADWHLSFFQHDDWREVEDYCARTGQYERYMTDMTGVGGSFANSLAIRVSVARCARVSYESFETGKRSTVDEDLKLYDRLVGAQPLHASPAEHQATPDTSYVPNDAMKDAPSHLWHSPHEHGNFVGWRQYRKMLPNEDVAPLPEAYQR